MTFVLVTGFGTTTQSAQKELSLRLLISSLLNTSGLEPKSPHERNRHALQRWEQHTPADRQQHQMHSLLVENLAIADLEVWNVLFSTNLPVVTSTYDLHAATALYRNRFGLDPSSLEDLRQVMLTWQSPICDLREFFTVGSAASREKVLYREGSVLHGNWLLGSRFGQAKRELVQLDRLFVTRRPLLLVGIEHGINSCFLKKHAQHAQEGGPPILRVVRSTAQGSPGVRDLHCEYEPRERFVARLREILLELI